jgi:hypothetical protein
MSGKLLLNNIELPAYRRNYAPGYITLEQTDRTIDGTLVSDIIGIKRRFDISWPVLEGAFMAQLITIYLAKQAVEFKEQQPDGSYLTFSCWLSIPESVLREIEIENYAFSGFSIGLVEI